MHTGVRSESRPMKLGHALWGVLFGLTHSLHSLIPFGKVVVINQILDVSSQELGNGSMVLVLEHNRVLLMKCEFSDNVQQDIADCIHQLCSSKYLARMYLMKWMMDTLIYSGVNRRQGCGNQWQWIAGRPRRRLRNAEKSGVDQHSSLCDYTLALTHYY